MSVPAQGGAAVQLNESEFAAILTAGGCSDTTECFVASRLADTLTAEAIAPDAYQWLSDWRDARLQPATLRITAQPGAGGAVDVTVSSSAVAPQVMVHCGEATDFGWFSDNGLMLLPGQNRTVTYAPRVGPLGTGAHTPCTGASSFYAVSVNGLSS